MFLVTRKSYIIGLKSCSNFGNSLTTQGEKVINFTQGKI